MCANRNNPMLFISSNDKTHYREEVAQLAEWCGANNLSLNVSKTKEVVMDFRLNSGGHPPLIIDSSTRLHFLRRLKKSKSPSTHFLQGNHWERADQLHHCLLR